jgi:tetratricopeptide (TPR) repeat protein
MNPRYAEAYTNRGITYAKKGQLDQAISDFNMALEISPKYGVAYYNRGIAYYLKRDYEKSLKDVEKAQSLAYQIDPKFLEELRKASGRQN